MMEEAHVYARNFSQGPWWVPGILCESNGPIAFKVELETGKWTYVEAASRSLDTES